MADPVRSNETINLIRRSGLVEAKRLDRVAGEAAADGPIALLDRLVADGLLTRFQADQLAAGRWKGFTVGEYRLLDRLGGGGMGQVFLAEHVTLGKRVAVKVLLGPLAADPAARRRFEREARAAAVVAHPNIVRVFAAHPHADPPYLVMEYVDGMSLQEAVARAGPFAPGAAAYCGRQAALGLARVAAAGLVHRDVKPANLLVDRRGLVKVLDMGIVRVTGEDSRPVSDTGWAILGTADYLAPEQAADSSRVDARADLYALGGTLYFLLAGHPPFPDGTPSEKLTLKAEADPPRIDRVRPEIPAGLAEVVHKLMARDPAARYPTPLAAAEALTPFADPGPDFPAPLFTTRPRTTLADIEGMLTPVLLAPADEQPAAPTLRLNVAPPARRSRLVLWMALGGGLAAAAAYGLSVLIGR